MGGEVKTKLVELWTDLYPGWQDMDSSVYAYSKPLIDKTPGTLRVRIVVELPCLGGSALLDHEATGKVLEVDKQ